MQAAPVFLDRDATVDKAARLMKDAAANGVGLVVFPEAFVPGYPDGVWRTIPSADRAWYDRLYEQAVEVPGPAIDALGAAAREASVYPAIGVNERDGGTLYNSLLFVAPDGSLLLRSMRREIRSQSLLGSDDRGAAIAARPAGSGCASRLSRWPIRGRRPVRHRPLRRPHPGRTPLPGPP